MFAKDELSFKHIRSINPCATYMKGRICMVKTKGSEHVLVANRQAAKHPTPENINVRFS